MLSNYRFSAIIAKMKKSNKVLNPHFAYNDLARWCRYQVKYDLSLKDLQSYILMKEHKLINIKHFYKDTHEVLPYLNLKLYTNVCDGYARRRKGGNAYCKTHGVFEKVRQALIGQPVDQWSGIPHILKKFIKKVSNKISRIIPAIKNKARRFVKLFKAITGGDPWLA